MNRREFFKYMIASGVCLYLPKIYPKEIPQEIVTPWMDFEKNLGCVPPYNVILRDDCPRDRIYLLDLNEIHINPWNDWMFEQ